MNGLSGRDLSCWRGERCLFSRFDFHLEPGMLLAVYGPNGSGKTSLLRLLAGLARPSTGGIRWNGRSITDEPDGYRASMIHIGHQKAVKGTLTVFENLEFLVHLRSRNRMTKKELERSLETAGLQRLADTPAGLLSEGQSRRLAVALVIALRPSLWLLDEPMASLDPEAVKAYRELVSEHCSGGGIVVLSSNVVLELSGALELRMREDELAIEGS